MIDKDVPQSGIPLLMSKSVLIAGIYAFSLAVSSAPTGGSIVAGSGSISASNLNIHQHSQNLAIDWDSFNISKDETFNVNQLNSSSVLLIRVRFNGVKKTGVKSQYLLI